MLHKLVNQAVNKLIKQKQHAVTGVVLSLCPCTILLHTGTL